jgi:YD repeat-containing protein
MGHDMHQINALLKRTQRCQIGVAVCWLATIPALPCAGATPNEVKVRTFSSDGVVEYSSHTYANGFGKKIQSVSENGLLDIVSGIEVDAYGRVVYSIKPTPLSAAHAYFPGSLRTAASSWYDGTPGKGPDAGGISYMETQYYEDPLDREAASGYPGAAFSIGGGHGAKTWHFGRISVSFIASPTDALLNSTSNEANAKYALDVFKDPNGNYSQVIKDMAGTVMSTREDAGPTSSGVMDAVNFPDFTGRILKALPQGESNSTDPTYSYFQYSATGQILSSDTPDEGMKQMVYNSSGELRFTQTERDLQPPYSGNRITSYKYDRIGRILEIGVVTGMPAAAIFSSYPDQMDFPSRVPPLGLSYVYQIKVRNYYDGTSGLGTDLGTPAALAAVLRNSRGRMVASIAFDESGDESSSLHRVEEYFSYDAEGRIEKKFKRIPGMQVQHFDYTYDLQGKILTKTFQVQDPTLTTTSFSDNWTYQYDGLGRLATISSNSTPLVTYDYNALGQVVGKHFKKGSSAIVDETFDYNVRDWLRSIRASGAVGGIYSEDLEYNAPSSPAVPQYNGNVTSAIHSYMSVGSNIFSFYKYDGANRLVNTLGTQGFAESFSYDSKGRITQKTEGPKAYGPYNYTSGTHQVESVSNSPMSSPLGNYVYDPNGNMILDRAKKMIVEYDWRGLPIAFKFFQSLPDRAIAWNEVASLNSTEGIVQTSEVQMMYDVSGNRVSKKVFHY